MPAGAEPKTPNSITESLQGCHRCTHSPCCPGHSSPPAWHCGLRPFSQPGRVSLVTLTSCWRLSNSDQVWTTLRGRTCRGIQSEGTPRYFLELNQVPTGSRGEFPQASSRQGKGSHFEIVQSTCSEQGLPQQKVQLTLETRSLNCVGPLLHGFFSINTVHAVNAFSLT